MLLPLSSIKEGVTNEGTIVPCKRRRERFLFPLEDQRGDSKHLVEFVIKPTRKKKSSDKNDYIGHPSDFFLHCLCPLVRRRASEALLL
jgi:hypothetical protein